MLPRVQNFRKITGSGLAALLAVSLTECGSPVPVPVSYPLTLQPEMQSAAHWQMVAADMWVEISRRLKAGGYNETAVGLEPPAAPSQFSHAMNDFLFTEIVNHGVAVSPGAEFTITYNVQVLQYHDHDAPVVPGIFTGLAGAGVPLAAAADFVNGWTPSDSQTELILTFSVIDNGAVRIRESKVYYIPDGDAGLYQAGGSGGNNSKNPVLDSNWYAANPHDVDREVAHENNEFNLMIDHANGPLHNITEATTAAVEHCASVGKSAARYIDQGFPENDRNTIRARYECE